MAEDDLNEDDIYTAGLTAEEKEMLEQYMGYEAPKKDEKHNVHTFLHNIAISRDTTKTGNLKEVEIGMPKLPARTYKELALYCNHICDKRVWGDYFGAEAEILTSTSLSKEGFLPKLAVVTKKQYEDIGKERKKNRGMFGFGKKDEVPSDGV